MSDSAVQWSPSTPALPPDHVLSSGAVIFPGAFDQHGCPLVLFPVETHNKLVRELTEEDVSDFIQYFLRLHNKSREECLVSAVADLREASRDVSRRVAESLLLLERRGQAVHSLYVVLPRQRGVAKHLHRLLLSGGSRANSPAPFKCVFLKEVFELSNFIDRSQLTARLGGYLIYCHQSWVSFVKEIDSFAQEFVAVVQRLPAYITALQDLSRLPLPVEAEPLALFCSAHQARLQQLRGDLALDDLLARCEQILEKFRCPESDPCYQTMAGSHLFMHTALEMLHNYDRISAAVEKVELLWQQAFSRARLQLQVLSLQREAQQIAGQMDSVWRGTLRSYKFEAAPSSSRAETLRLQFEASVYTHAMALVRRAEDVIHTVEEVVPSGAGRVRELWLAELQQETDRFRTAVELLYNSFRAACHFHHCYEKVQSWYSLAVCEGFLQDLLWSRCGSRDDLCLLGGAPADSSCWRPALEAFLRLHPCPEVEELVELAHLARALPELHLQDAAAQLAHRCMTLRKLMTSPGSATLRDLQLALQWQYEHLRRNHETMATTSDLSPGRNRSAEGGDEGERSVPRDSGLRLGPSPCGNTAGLPKQDVKDAPVFPSGIAAADSVPATGKPPSLSSLDSGFDGAGSSHLEAASGKEVPEGLPSVPFSEGGPSWLQTPPSQVNHANGPPVPSASGWEQRGEEPAAPQPSIHIVPRITADSLNLEIQVKRSATLPRNPWLSLPVEDLESSYTVTISPRQQRALHSPVPSERSRDQLTQTDAQACDHGNHGSPQRPCASHTCHGPQVALSPIHKVLSSTITDAADQSDSTTHTTPTLLWDTYDLRDLTHDSSNRLLCSILDASLGDWELKEEAALQAVEDALGRTAGILQEEENALAQEEALDFLLQVEPMEREWSAWSGRIRLTQMSSSDLAEAGVIGLEDDITSHLSCHDNVIAECPGSERPGGGGLLHELKNLQALDQQIVEENQKLCALELRSHGAEERPSEEMAVRSSVWGCTENRRRFLEVLEQEKKEVEEMERSVSGEVEIKGRQQRQQAKGHKVIKCSIMERAAALIHNREEDVGDEALLMSCRRESHDGKHLQPSNHEEQCLTLKESSHTQPYTSSTDEAGHCNLSAEVQIESTSNCLDTRQDLLCSAVVTEPDTVAPAVPSGHASECDALDVQKRELSDSTRATSDLPDACVSVGEQEIFPGLPDGLEEGHVLVDTTGTLGTAKHAQSDHTLHENCRHDEDQCCKMKTTDAQVEAGPRPVMSDAQVEAGPSPVMSDAQVEEVMEAGQERAFDPGGTGPLPRLPRSRRLILPDQANSVSQEDLQDASNHDPDVPGVPSAPSVGPKPKERRTPPRSNLQSLPAILGHNNNNNNSGCVDLHLPEHSTGPQVLLEQLTAGSDSGERIDAAAERGIESEGLISAMACQLCETLISEAETARPSEVSTLGGGFKQREATVTYNVWTRNISRSPEPQLHICASEMSDFLTPVVLDTGSGLVKAGFADQDLPSTVFPTAIGMPKYEEVMSGSAERDVYVGHEAQHMRGVLTLHYPMRNGIVSNWDHMERIWQHAFQQLRVDPEDHPVLLTEGVMVPQGNRQRMVQLMFESFNVPHTYVALQPVLALYAAGRTTGVVFDSGDGVSHSVPVFEGYCLPHAVQRLPLAGADVTLQLKQLLLEQGVCMRTSAELEIVREMKERCCCLALDYEAELGLGGARTQMHYTLPDGHVVSLTTERFRAPEILFKPELIGRDHYGMHESIFKSILQSDIDLRKSFLENIVLSGGNTLLPGLCERLRLEISRLAPAEGSGTVRVVSPPQRDFSVWKGGTVLSRLPALSSAWISRDEYEEFGPQIVFRKCF